MPASYGSAGNLRKRAGEGGAVGVNGFTQLVRALRRIEGGVYPELRMRLKAVGELVASQARANAPVGDNSPHLNQSIKVSITQAGASVYSTSPYGGVQNVGGWSNGRGPHVSRNSASHYMNKAVSEKQAVVLAELDGLVTWLLTTFEE